MHSLKFEYLREKYKNGYISEETLLKWVDLNNKFPGKGITQEEYFEIISEV